MRFALRGASLRCLRCGGSAVVSLGFESHAAVIAECRLCGQRREWSEFEVARALGTLEDVPPRREPRPHRPRSEGPLRECPTHRVARRFTRSGRGYCHLCNRERWARYRAARAA